MPWKKTTYFVIAGIFGLAILIGVYDLLANIFGGGGTTISEVTWEFDKNHHHAFTLICSIISMIFGGLVIHLTQGGQSD